MHKLFLTRLLVGVATVLLMSAPSGEALAGTIDPAADGSKYAWGENVGWINFAPTSGPGVTVTGSTVTGKAWGENIG